ncbi:hypothetical protein FHX57_006802 [Paraburkholderia tropica]|uniref:hypothetical protein n=1 Tax=Paraburkholderia tropica TaxID=92647 RepID=UPI0016099A65|nr:hypothetical protein [Paraburkholderia tropica]MBB3004420.1 hypothetical protein [Paraburkholderia tropica]
MSEKKVTDSAYKPCGDERPCTACFTDNGPCERPSLESLIAQADLQIGDGHIDRARETLQRAIELAHDKTVATDTAAPSVSQCGECERAGIGLCAPGTCCKSAAQPDARAAAPQAALKDEEAWMMFDRICAENKGKTMFSAIGIFARALLEARSKP